MKRLIKLAVICACATAVACGGTEKSATTPKKTEQPKKPKTVDKVYKYDGYTLQGMRFEPQAFGRPVVLQVKPPRRTSMGRAARLARFKPGKKWPKNAKVDHILVYVSKLWHTKTKKPEAQKKNRVKAREILTKLYGVAHDAKSYNAEVVMRMLSAMLLEAQDVPGSLKVMEEQLTLFPATEAAPHTRAWAAYYLLRQDKTKEAAAMAGAGVPDNRRGHYVKAWTAFRNRKFDEVNTEVKAAVDKWKGSKRVIRTEAVLLMGRSGASLADIDAQIQKLAGGSEPVRYRLLYTAQQVFLLVGRYADAIKALDMLATSVVKTVPPNDLVNFRLVQAGLYYRINEPLKSVEAAFAAQQGLGPCADKCAKLKNPVLATLFQLAQVYHTIFASSLDERYHQAAVKLYDAYLAITPPRPDKANATRFYDSLKATKKNTAAAAGFHNNPKALQNILSFRREGPLACYESVLQGQKDLAGVVTTTTEFDETGKITGVTTDPARGAEGLAAVAGCIQDHIKKYWTFPARTVPGKTVTVVPYTFSPKTK